LRKITQQDRRGRRIGDMIEEKEWSKRTKKDRKGRKTVIVMKTIKRHDKTKVATNEKEENKETRKRRQTI
jgi:hypothetical protein